MNPFHYEAGDECFPESGGQNDYRVPNQASNESQELLALWILSANEEIADFEISVEV